MKKILILPLVLLALAVSSQENLFTLPQGQKNRALSSEKCGFAIVMENAKARGYNEARFENWMAQKIAERRNQLQPDGPPATIYTVPIVFHILYDGNTESTIGTGNNIFASKVYAQIEQLNKDFADLSGSVYAVAEHMGVQFAPARKNPSDVYMCEGGINRINWRAQGWTDPASFTSPTTLINYFDATIKPASIWNPNDYVNVWLANMSGSGLLGYATFPANSTLAGLDNSETNSTAGAVVLTGSVGSISDPGPVNNYALGRTLTHELGHFFGLRHIWGDGNCSATDYCNDTPPQNGSTTGCPATGTLNGCTPSVPKMFENYMDYSYDGCLNTFTLNQSERCQTVMANSPRRIQLISSTKAVSPNPNRIYVKTANSSVSEASVMSSCPKYTDYTITIGIESNATGAATLSLSRAGTASEGIDYTITPAAVTYTNGETADKTFTLRIFDDAIVEGTETINLDLSISGTGVTTVPACGATAFTVSITDNDIVQTINNANPIVTLLNEGFATAALPSGWVKSDNGASNTNTWVVNNTDNNSWGTFTGNTAHITNGTAGSGMVYTANAPADARLITPSLNASGLKNLTLSFSYVCNGELAAGTYYDYGFVYYSTDGISYAVLRDVSNNPVVFQGVTTKTTISMNLPPAANNASSLRIMFRWLNDNSVRNNPPFAIDDIVITGNVTTVESQLNNTATENISAAPGSSIFYAADGEIIAAVTNPNISLGCVTANISQAGNGTSTLTTSTGSFQRSNKVITLVPVVANTTASYTATFYFTTAEVAAWPNATTLKLMKVKDGVNLGSIISSANATIVTPTVNDLRTTNGYITYTAAFTGGFSQFMLVSSNTTLPVSYISFTATALDKSIALNWQVATELNNLGFEVERSTNGTDFEQIGWVNGRGTATGQGSYSFNDNYVVPGVYYYYRLRQKDMDGKENLSVIRRAIITGSRMQVLISPNPASESFRIFVPGWDGMAGLSLYDANGRLV
ncbi:MAG TPA: M43 family zinc metalloprotease, partial [Chitinophagaceae bacterium]|nr:M43 family zinc metalloprotease [Chitinophagaceae bacterium]